ncbi:MAG: SGNH/GDSL hydrolase family protein [Phycisphaerales bacterium]
MHRRSCAAQDFLSVPYVATAEPAVFRTLFTSARFGTGIHALIIGDSQETCPLGHGINYVPAFNAEWARRYGVSPRTPLIQPGLTTSDTNGEWLVRSTNLTPAFTNPSDSFAANALPGLANWLIPAPSSGQRGWAMVLQPSAVGVNPDLPIDRTRTWFDASQGVYLDIYAVRDAANITVTLSLAPSSAPTGAAAPLATFTTNLAAAPDTGPVARQRFGPVTWNAAANPSACIQAEFVGANPIRLSRLVSASFVSVAADAGLTATDIAAGGYTAASLITNHAAALPHLRALGADAAFITLGANDVWYPPAQFKQNLAALIAALRQNTTPNLPIVIITDPARGWSTPDADAIAELFPRAAAELAAELPGVCAINSRRLTHEQGWTTANLDPFTLDKIHFTPQSAALKARLDIGTIWDAFVCPADIGTQGGVTGADGQLDNNDFVAFISAFFARRPVADMGGQGGLPGADGQYDNNDFIAFISAFFDGCP